MKHPWHKTTGLCIPLFVSFAIALTVITCGYAPASSSNPNVDICDQLSDIQEFDLNSVHSSILEGTAEPDRTIWNYRISGTDYHAESATIHGIKVEVISVGGEINYFREGNAEWQVLREFDEIKPLKFPYKLDSACPDLTHFNYIGQETLDGRTVKRYAAPTVTLNLPEPRIVAAWEYLVDIDGVLVRAENTRDTGLVDNHQEVQVVDFSNFGTPNPIVDPFPSGTPTPTATTTHEFALARVERVEPTPTPTPTPTATPFGTPTATPTATPTPTPTPIPLISNLIPENTEDIEMRVGETVTLTVNVYDLQYNLDNSLAEDVTFDWLHSPLAGKFAEAETNANGDGIVNDRSVKFTARNIGYHLVVAQLEPWECVGRCATEIRIFIRR